MHPSFGDILPYVQLPSTIMVVRDIFTESQTAAAVYSSIEVDHYTPSGLVGPAARNNHVWQ